MQPPPVPTYAHILSSNKIYLDVRSVLILISHDHDFAVAEALQILHGLVRLLVGEAHDLDQVVDLLVLHDLFV